MRLGRRVRARAWAATLVAVAALTGGCGMLAIGRSVEQREIIAQTFGDGDRVVVLIGGLHTGPEDNTRILAEQIAAYLSAHPEAVPPSLHVVVVAAANPDGSANGWHTNAHGVDLNRNWPADDWTTNACHPVTGCQRGLGGPAPLSEPETLALYRLLEALRPEITVVWHAEAPLVEANEVPGAERYARAYGDATGYAYIAEWSAYEITGELIDALEQRLWLRAFDVELSACCTITADEFTRNLDGVLALFEAVERGDGDPQQERTPRPTPTEINLDQLEGL
jgi:predicted deacylase